jgi:hypothetical protein
MPIAKLPEYTHNRWKLKVLEINLEHFDRLSDIRLDWKYGIANIKWYIFGCIEFR